MNVYTKEEYLLLANMVSKIILINNFKNTDFYGNLILLNILQESYIERIPEGLQHFFNQLKEHRQPKLKYDAIYNLSIEKIVLLLNDKDLTIKTIAAWRVLIGR